MKHIKVSLLSSITILSLSSNTAYAQSAGEGLLLDEIVVTSARGRVENPIDVPISQTIFNASDIADARIDQVDDFLALTPGVTFSNAQDAGTNFISIRGLSQTRNGEPPVAVVVDGVLQTNSRTFDQPLFDVASVEVLRGPQGALYGRNATGGAILINTKGPTNETEGYVQGTLGQDEEIGLEASVSGAIIEDTLMYRLSGHYNDRDGYLHNTTLGTGVDYKQDLAVRGHLSFYPTDKTTVDFRAAMVRTDAGSLNFSYQPALVDDDGAFSGLDFSLLDANIVQREFTANNLGLDNRDFEQLSLRVNFDLDFADLLLTTGYDNINQSTGSDQFPYTAAANITLFGASADNIQSQYFDINTLSQEVRLTSKDEGPLNWMVGGYYLDTERFVSSTITEDTGNGVTRVKRTPDLTSTTAPILSFVADDNNNTAWAAFFNASYDVTDRLELAFAGRYDNDEREQIVSDVQGAYDDGVLVAEIGEAGAVNTAEFSMFQPKVSARYNLSDSASVYASWGKGFRSGQFNQNGVGEVLADAGIDGAGDLIDQEETETFEIGGKADVAQGLTLTGAAFDTTVTNAPYFVFIGAVSAQILVPIDEISIKGVEGEISYNVNESFDVYAGVSFTDSEIQDYSLNSDLVGNRAPYIADNTFNVGAQFRTPINNSLGFFARADLEKRGGQFWDPENSTERDDLFLSNMRFGIEDLNDVWSLTISGDNIFDEAYNSEWVSGGFAHAGTPSVWRADLRYNF